LWFVPALAVAFACGGAAALNGVEVGDESWLSDAVFPGGAESARSILQAIAGSVITVTGVVFSLTVVTLQLASTQFSPRLLRTFLRDVSNQLVLGTFLATFAYSLVVLRAVESATPGQPESVPAAAVTGAYVLTAASVAALVYFVDRIARSIRVDSLMREVNEDTVKIIRHVDRSDDGHGATTEPIVRCDAVVPAARSGFVQAVDESHLARAATAAASVVRVEAMIGDRVIEGAPLARLELQDGPGDVPQQLGQAVVAAVQVGYERTMQQDVAYGLRQLVDVAVKALSPGVNDPTTATHAIGHLAHLLVRLARTPVGTRVTSDDKGAVRVVLPGPSFDGYLALACNQIRRYGSGEPAVTEELLRLLLDVARADHPGAHADALRHQADVIVSAAERHTVEPTDLHALYGLRKEIDETIADRS
jgi:uncharacterized membrane protein